MSRPDYSGCRCCECRGIHCMVFHPGHSCKARAMYYDNWWWDKFQERLDDVEQELSGGKTDGVGKQEKVGE